MDDITYLKKYLKKIPLEEGLKRLENGEPVQYIVGNVSFYGYPIKVNPNVLIPRFETEELVEKAINYIQQLFKKNISIADIGTGSGCIAIALKKRLLNCNITATDISKEALDTAFMNASINEVSIKFLQGNLLEPLTEKYDVIISNPPYLKKSDDIMEIVDKNEPHLALYADHNGLFFYEEILKNCVSYLNTQFLIAFEIGHTQGKQIEAIVHKHLQDVIIKIEQDLQEKDRFVFIYHI